MGEVAEPCQIGRGVSVVVHVDWQVLVSSWVSLVQAQDQTTKLSVLWPGELLNARNVRHRLHSVLRVKPSNEPIVLLNLCPCPPDPPEMNVPRLYPFNRVRTH